MPTLAPTGTPADYQAQLQCCYSRKQVRISALHAIKTLCKLRPALLRALFQEPDILLADEPVSQLDGYLAGRVLGLLRQQADERGCTVICVLHDPTLVERFADYSLSLNPQDPEGWRVRTVRPVPHE